MENRLKYNVGNIIIENYYNDLGDRIIRLENMSDRNINIKIHYYYSSVFFPYYEFSTTLNSKTWVLPDFEEIKNCSFIIVYLDNEVKTMITLLSNKNLKNVRDKVICVGLNKTGTSSLTRNLKNLGLITWADGKPQNNLGFSNYTFNNKSIGNIIDLIEKTNVDFFQDIPFSCPKISERIINIFPQCRYILTKRESADTWVNSVINFWSKYFNSGELKLNMVTVNEHSLNIGNIKIPTYLLNMFETWDIESYNGDLYEKLSQVYENHNLSVKNTLITNNCDWIEIDVSKKGELKKLTEWLGIENEEEDFLWINKTKR
jgi:hypothetical protein